MKLREILSKARMQFSAWLRAHRRGLLVTFSYLLSFSLGGGYYLLAPRFSLPLLSPLGALIPPVNESVLAAVIKDVPHPISGVYFSAEEAKFWQAKRPLAVMIDNHELARRYQYGLQGADLVYEAVAEGGITRFLAIFHRQNVAKIGPVRSARVYYAGWSMEFGGYYSHVGGAGKPGPADVFTFISQNGIYSLNQFRLGSPTYTFGGNVIFRNGAVLSHINYTSTAKLWAGAQKIHRGTNNLPKFSSWKVKAEDPYVLRPKSQKIAFQFWGWPTAYSGEWRYDRFTNSYLRFQGGAKHVDQATKKQLSAKNVVLAYMHERPAGDGTAHRLYNSTGSGNALVYRDGKRILATWKRSSLKARTKFYKRGTSTEIAFNKGLTWIEVVPN
ncbi:MAG: DUF3048 domain-containing protein [Patescibacteria group bacterium]